jgi:hypothetical protein
MAVVYFLKLINSVFYQGYFPTRWKQSEVLFIPKSNHTSDYAKDCRSFSLLSCVDKTVESIILTKFKKFANFTNLLPPHQFDFRGGHFTTQQILRIVENNTKVLTYKQSTVTVS